MLYSSFNLPYMLLCWDSYWYNVALNTLRDNRIDSKMNIFVPINTVDLFYTTLCLGTIERRHLLVTFCDLLKSNSTVKKLYLTGQEFDDDGLIMLLNAIKCNPDSAVEELTANNFHFKDSKDIHGYNSFNNSCGDKSLAVLIDFIKTNKTIKYIYIAFHKTCVDLSDKYLIEEAILDNHTITRFNCDCVVFCPSDWKILYLLLKANTNYVSSAAKDTDELKRIKIAILATNREEGYAYPGDDMLNDGEVGVQILE